MIRIQILLGLIFTMTCAMAQEQWDYVRCADYALANNPDILNGEIDLKHQKLIYRNAKNGMLPSLSGDVGYNINRGRSIDPTTNKVIEDSGNGFYSNTYGLNAQMVLFNGFFKHNRIAYEKYNLQIEDDRLARLKNNLTYDVLEQFGSVLHFQGLKEIFEEQYQLTLRELDKTKRMYELGRMAKTEVYEMEARLSSDSYRRLYYKNQAKKALLRLKQFMHYPSDSTLYIKDIDLPVVDVSLSKRKLFDQAAKALPEIQMLEKSLKVAKKEIQMIKSQMTPTISAYARVGTGYFETKTDSLNQTLPFDIQMEGNRNTNYGLSMSIPIFRSFQKQNQLKRAKLGYEQRKLDRKKGLENLEYQIAEAIMDLNAEKENYLASQKNFTSQGIAFKAAEKKRENGLISLMDFYESKNNLANSQTEVLASKIHLFLKEKTIHFYLTGTFVD